ncbi:metallophosphoesterase [Catelliglobosispora koreensis]|uniref:metallophosphoesterase n=1 Tax=Catelliglobosispora koreensis TaxID=129052 RepID=UPI001B7F94D8|nr:metallophosphoesterase [Catelliglobosispora koreensis]
MSILRMRHLYLAVSISCTNQGMRRFLVLTAFAGTLLMAVPAAAAPHAHGSAPVTFALLGDTPYGDAQRVIFPSLVTAINADPKVRFVLHAGDIKNGSSTCDDARFADLAALYGTFADPFVLTPGDNEWTDCHRTAAGRYVPTERLEAVRRIFYPIPGLTLGQHRMPVLPQSLDPRHRPYVENTLFLRNRVVFAAVHVVGSENDLAPWSQLPGGDQPSVRLAEFDARLAAALDWIDFSFATAWHSGAAGVFLLMQAEPLDTPGFAQIRARIVQHSLEYGKPVVLAHGDEHVYEVEPGYAGVPNLTRLETFGDTATEWLKVTADPRKASVFSWEPLSITPQA